jgi:hypothetical protein
MHRSDGDESRPCIEALPLRIQKFCNKCLKRDPSHRLQSAHQVLDELTSSQFL